MRKDEYIVEPGDGRLRGVDIDWSCIGTAMVFLKYCEKYNFEPYFGEPVESGLQ